MSKRQELLNEIKNIVFSFFIKSFDFNGISLRDISKNLGIGYKESIELIKELVVTDIVSIQSSTNPLICAELAGDVHLGYARQLTDKSSLLFDLAF